MQSTSAPTIRLPWLIIAALLSLTALPHQSLAQLTPSKLYCSVNKSIPMTVETPDGADGDIEIALLEPVSAREVERAVVQAGTIDLASVFPVLWARQQAPLLYAQLIIDGEKVGSAVVLQPLITPLVVINEGFNQEIRNAFDAGDRRRLEQLLSGERPTSIYRLNFPTQQQSAYSGLRVYTDRNILFETDKGDIKIALRPDQAPNMSFNLIHLVEGGFYDQTLIHRVVGETKFVIQFGDPTASGLGGPGYYLDLEPSRIQHDFGVVSMARSPEPNANGSQLFICLSRRGTKSLDGLYTAFGHTISGADTLITLENTPVHPDSDRPIEPPTILSAKTIPAPPYGEGPPPVTRPDPDPNQR